MLIKEVCKMTKLTKKAVEYYIEKGLVHPTILENVSYQMKVVRHYKKFQPKKN